MSAFKFNFTFCVSFIPFCGFKACETPFDVNWNVHFIENIKHSIYSHLHGLWIFNVLTEKKITEL